ncbi:MAG TPA: hypothetical protein VOA88_08450 [Candidatus Dormibacteraeota bacterium]|nr:hypothetical protein [Candidatus Dormibacteraeota bacterium]
MNLGKPVLRAQHAAHNQLFIDYDGVNPFVSTKVGSKHLKNVSLNPLFLPIKQGKVAIVTSMSSKRHEAPALLGSKVITPMESGARLLLSLL